MSCGNAKKETGAFHLNGKGPSVCTSRPKHPVLQYLSPSEPIVFHHRKLINEEEDWAVMGSITLRHPEALLTEKEDTH